MNQPMGTSMAEHVKIVAWLNIVSGGLLLLLALFLGGALTIAGVASGEAEAFGILTAVGGFLSVVFGVMALPSILGGWGLLKRKEWSRILVLVLSFLNLMNVPVGTLIGGYSIWVLLQDDTRRLLSEPGYPELPRY